jgi:hypothetical protein
MKEQLISIETKRYSEFFRHLLEEYAETSRIMIDGHPFEGSDLAELKSWCVNEQIKQTRNFKLTRGKMDLFGFHDSPGELWAAMTELPFVERMAKAKLIRFRLPPVSASTE